MKAFRRFLIRPIGGAPGLPKGYGYDSHDTPEREVHKLVQTSPAKPQMENPSRNS